MVGPAALLADQVQVAGGEDVVQKVGQHDAARVGLDPGHEQIVHVRDRLGLGGVGLLDPLAALQDGLRPGRGSLLIRVVTLQGGHVLADQRLDLGAVQVAGDEHRQVGEIAEGAAVHILQQGHVHGLDGRGIEGMQPGVVAIDLPGIFLLKGHAGALLARQVLEVVGLGLRQAAFRAEIRLLEQQPAGLEGGLLLAAPGVQVQGRGALLGVEDDAHPGELGIILQVLPLDAAKADRTVVVGRGVARSGDPVGRIAPVAGVEAPGGRQVVVRAHRRRLLVVHLRAVGEQPLLVAAQAPARGPLHDAARRRLHAEVQLRVVDELRRERLRIHARQDGAHLVGGRGDARVLHGVVAGGIDGLALEEHPGGIVLQALPADAGEDAVLDVPELDRTHQRMVAQEMLQRHVHQVLALHVLATELAVQVVALRDAEPRRLELVRADAEGEQAPDLPGGHFHAGRQLLLVLGRDGEEADEVVRLVLVRHQHRGAGGRLGLLREPAQALGEHRRDDLAAEGVADVFLRDPLRALRIGLLEEELDHVDLEVPVGHVLDQRQGPLRGQVALLLRGVDGLRDVGELRPDPGLHVVHVEVADHDDRLQVGAVPLMIEVQDLLALEAVDDLVGADHRPLRLLGALVDESVLEIVDARARVVAQAPFFADHAPLVVQRLLLAGDVAGPVVQHQQHRVHERAAHQGHGRDVVDRLVA